MLRGAHLRPRRHARRHRGNAPPGVQRRVHRVRPVVGLEPAALRAAAARLRRQGAPRALHRHAAVLPRPSATGCSRTCRRCTAYQDAHLHRADRARPRAVPPRRAAAAARGEARGLKLAHRLHHHLGQRRRAAATRIWAHAPTSAFDVIACGDQVPAKKPAPDIYRLALVSLRLAADACVAFEDSLNGLRAAKAAGLVDRGDAVALDRGAGLRRRGPGAALARGLDLHAALIATRCWEKRMPQLETTLTEFIIGEQRRFPGATGGFTALVNDIRLACKRIAYLVGKGALAGMHGSAGSRNVQGEEQQKLDVLANEIFLRTNEWGGHLAGMASRRARASRTAFRTSTRAGATCSRSIRWTARPTSTSTSRWARSSRCSPARRA